MPALDRDGERTLARSLAGAPRAADRCLMRRGPGGCLEGAVRAVTGWDWPREATTALPCAVRWCGQDAGVWFRMCQGASSRGQAGRQLALDKTNPDRVPVCWPFVAALSAPAAPRGRTRSVRRASRGRWIVPRSRQLPLHTNGGDRWAAPRGCGLGVRSAA